jgi:hypothetical protein
MAFFLALARRLWLRIIQWGNKGFTQPTGIYDL